MKTKLFFFLFSLLFACTLWAAGEGSDGGGHKVSPTLDNSTKIETERYLTRPKEGEAQLSLEVVKKDSVQFSEILLKDILRINFGEDNSAEVQLRFYYVDIMKSGNKKLDELSISDLLAVETADGQIIARSEILEIVVKKIQVPTP